jgi:hypothetical protein
LLCGAPAAHCAARKPWKAIRSAIAKTPARRARSEKPPRTDRQHHQHDQRHVNRRENAAIQRHVRVEERNRHEHEADVDGKEPHERAAQAGGVVDVAASPIGSIHRIRRADRIAPRIPRRQEQYCEHRDPDQQPERHHRQHQPDRRRIAWLPRYDPAGDGHEGVLQVAAVRQVHRKRVARPHPA